MRHPIKIIILWLTCSLCSAQDLDFKILIDNFQSPYTVYKFDSIFKNSRKELYSYLNTINENNEKFYDNWSQNKQKYLFLLDSILIPDEEFDIVLLLVSQLEKIEKKNRPFDTTYVIDLLNIRAEYLKQRGEKISSRAIREEAIELLKSQNPMDHYRLAKTLFFYQFLFTESEPQKTIDILHEAESSLLKMDAPNDLLERKIYTEIQKYYNYRGYRMEAQQYFEKIWSPYLVNGKYEFKSLSEEADFLYESMLFYRFTGDNSNIEEIKNKAWKFYQNHGKNPDFPRISIAGVYSTYGDNIVNDNPSKALLAYEQALQINTQPDSYHLQYLFNIAKAQLYMGNPDRALEVIEKVIPIAKLNNDTRLAFFYAMKGNIYLVNKNIDQAVVFFNQMMNEVNQNSNSIDLASTAPMNLTPSERFNELFMLLTMAERVNDNFPNHHSTPTVCFNLYSGALKIMAFNLDNNTPNEFLLNTLGKIISGLYENYIKNNALRLPIDEMIITTEQLNAGYLWEKFKANHSDFSLIDSSLLRREEKLRANIISLKKSNDENKDQLVFEQEVLLQDLEKEKKKRFPGYAKFSDFHFDLDTFINQIPENLIVLRYALYGDAYYLYTINNGAINFQQIGLAEQVNDQAESLYELIRTPFSDLDSLKAHSIQLASLILPKDIQDNLSVLIIPDGILNYIPYDLLISEDDYLISNYYISYAVSLALCKPFSIEKKLLKIALFAPSYSDSSPANDDLISMRSEDYDLEGTKSEVSKINDVVKSDLFLEDVATKQLFKAIAHQYDVLHLSMHSFINEEDPDLSLLAFADIEEDDELYLNELYGMNLNAELAVLSACNTGIGPDKSGSGIVSLNRAFQYAGVPSIISSLWSVPDKATSEIMTSMYHHFVQSDSKSSALRKAKLEFINKNEHSPLIHPFYWAGFVIHGSNDAIVFKNSYGWIGYLGVGLFLILGIVYWVRRRLNA